MANFAGQLVSTRTDGQMIFSDNVYDKGKSKLVSELFENIPSSGFDGYKVTVETLETPTSGYLKTYAIKQDNATLGTIDIPKDFLVKSGSIAKGSWDGDKFTPSDSGSDKALKLVINTKDASATDDAIYINVKDLVDVYTAGDGISISDGNVVSVKIASDSESFLSIDTNGVAVKGVQNAITTAVSDAVTKAEYLTSIASGNGITVSEKADKAQSVSLKLNSTKTDNALIVDDDGLYLSSTIDGGEY